MRMDMFLHILKRDLRRKKTMNVILLLFIILATMFLAASVNNLIAVNGAIDHFIEVANVPDFFALALSENGEDEIEEFLRENQKVTEYEVADTFNITNDRISFTECQEEPDKTEYERTNTMCLEAVPENFMKVFGMDDSRLALKPGEIAFPKVEADANNVRLGDRVRIKVGEIEQEFTVAAIIKDAVFGSTMMGFRRLVISEEDFARYEEQENLIYVKIYNVNYTDKKDFEDSWKIENFNVISALDGSTVRLCYIMDMLVAGVLIVVSVCLILISFLVLRFTIVFTLQEDYKEIGIMKAIGIRERGIKELYLIKYFVLSVAGAFIGGVLSIPFGDMLLKQAIVNIVVDRAEQNFLINAGCAVIIVLIVLTFCYGSTNKLKKYSAMDAIRSGSNGERYMVKNPLKLWKRKWMPAYLYMALNDILSSLKRYGMLGATFCLGTMLILLPLSAQHTLKSEKIVSLFSLSPSDVFLDNGKTDSYVAEENGEMLYGDLEEIELRLQENGLKGKAGAELGYLLPCYTDDIHNCCNYYIWQGVGSWEREYQLLEGREPVLENEVMITELTAEEMEVGIGDSVFFLVGEEEQEFVITGTYQSMMNLGQGFRVSRETKFPYEYMSGIICMQIEVEDMESQEAYERCTEIFPECKILTGEEFLDSMIGDVKKQLDVVMHFIVVIVLIINALITALMMKTIMTKERGDIALVKSIGFSNFAVKAWQVARILMILAGAIVLGTVLSEVLAPFVIGPIFAMMGANKIELMVNPLEAYVIYPLLLLAVTSAASIFCAGGIHRVECREVNSME